MGWSKARFWSVAGGVAFAAWGVAMLGSFEFESSRAKEDAAISAENAKAGGAPGKAPELGEAEKKAQAEMEPNEAYPKYIWGIAPIPDKAAMGTHAIVESSDGDNCDLTPGWQCDLAAVAGKDGKVSVPIHWRRPLGDKLAAVVGSHPYGDAMALGPKGASASGFAPGQKLRLRVAMWAFTKSQGESDNFKRVYRDGAGLVDCYDVCLLAFGKFVPVAEPAREPAKPSEPAFAPKPRGPKPMGWIERGWPSGWMTGAPPLAVLLLAAISPWARRAVKAARVIAGRPGSTLALAPVGGK